MWDPRDVPEKSGSDELQQNQRESWRDVVPPEKPWASTSAELMSGQGCYFIVGYFVFFAIMIVLSPLLRELPPIDPAVATIGFFLGIPVVFLLVVWWVNRQQNQSFTPNVSYDTALDPREAEQNPRLALPPREPQPHALDAVRAAGFDPDAKLAALPYDIGVIAFWDEHTAYAHRTIAVSTTATALQPYIELDLRHEGQWRIKFEVLDSSGKTVFEQQVTRDLLPSRRLLMTPPARLPLADLQRDGEWTLRVSANEELLAVHHFTWRSDDLDSLEGNIDSDGDIDESILPLLADNYAQPLSLDALLAVRSESSD